jgi:hypothetical protein
VAAFNKFNQFVADVANKIHNLGTDALKILLTNTAPVPTNAVKADVTEITAGNGYTAGGAAAPVASSTQTGGLYKLIPTGTGLVTWTGTGTFGPFRYAVLYNSTPAAGNLVGWWDYGSAISVNNGDTFTVDLDEINGILQLQ